MIDLFKLFKKGPQAEPENYNSLKKFAELMDQIYEDREPVSKECEGPDNEMGIQ